MSQYRNIEIDSLGKELDYNWRDLAEKAIQLEEENSKLEDELEVLNEKLNEVIKELEVSIGNK